MNIYVDISDMWYLSYVTGIQRTVKEVLGVWRAEKKDNIWLLIYNPKKRVFDIVPNSDMDRVLAAKGKNRRLKPVRQMMAADFGKDDLLFDIDSIWNRPIRRSWLLSELHGRGTKIATHVYDMIPITEPQYCHSQTVGNYIEYIGAHLTYSNLIITNAQATQDAIDMVLGDAVRPEMRRAVVPLGCDFAKGRRPEAKSKRGVQDVYAADGGRLNVRDSILNIVGKSKYILMVGTLEPRKNHAYVLDAFERGLFDKGMNLVIAGRPGWNIDAFMERIKKHPLNGKQLFYIDDGTDDDITYLYSKAFAVAIASFNEGFGLPIIEARQQGVPVLASDIPVFREIGGDYCTYFDLNDPADFVRHAEMGVKQDHTDNNNDGFKVQTWQQAADKMYEELEALFA